jgi:general secretion pathway protein L
MDSTLTASFPQVRAIRDAPVQMQRETDQLRATAGRSSDQDLETLLAAAATAWPAERGPVETLSFESGRLSLSANGWSDAQVQQFRSQLSSEGWQLDAVEGRLTLSRAQGPASSNANKT